MRQVAPAAHHKRLQRGPVWCGSGQRFLGWCLFSVKPLEGGGGAGGLKLVSTHHNTALLSSTHRQVPQSATLRCSRPSAWHLPAAS